MSNQNQDIKRITVRLEHCDYENIQQKSKDEGFSTLNKFIIHIINDYLDNGPMATREISSDLDELEKLLSKQRDFLQNLDSVMRASAKEDKPDKFEEKTSRILSLLGSSRMKFGDICKITGISEIDTHIILGHLYDKGVILFNQNFEWYKI